MTPRLFIKLRRDLQAIWDRILLMILALSVALIMFSAVLYIWSVSAREMPRDYLSGSPASATLLLQQGLNVNQAADIAAKVRQQPGIIDATLRTQFSLRIQQKDGTWGPIPLQIFVAAPEDPMRIETFEIEQGSWPLAAGEILIEQSALDLLNLKVGDTIVVQTPGGEGASLRISGAVHTPGLTPAFQEQTGHGFISTASLLGLGEPLALDALKIQVADQPGLTTPSRNRDAIVSTARNLAGWLRQTYGMTVEEIQVPQPYAHPHQGQMDSLMAGLFTFGAGALLLSAILIATMLNGLLTQQIPQIGIMKAIGARSSRILQLYLLMTLVIAVTSTALAFVPGILISQRFTPVMLTLLGVRAESLAAPWWAYAVVVAAGIGVPLLLALGSLLKASRTTVREALDYRGVDRQGDISTRFDAGLSRLRGLDRTVLMAFRNIFRRRTRLLLTVGLLGIAGAVFVAGMSTLNSFQTFLDRETQLRRWDVEVQLAERNGNSPALAVALTDLVAKIPDVTHVEGWSIVQTSVVPLGQEFSVTRTYPDQGHGSVSVTVVPPDSSLVATPRLAEGRWLRPDDVGAIVLSRTGLTEDLTGIRSGDTLQLSLNGRLTRWLVVGLSEPIGGRGGIFITQAGYEAATGVSQPGLLRIVTNKHDEVTRTAVAQAVARTLTGAGVVVQNSVSVGRAEAVSVGHLLPLMLVFLGLAIAISVVGFAGLTSTMSTNVLERTREFGVMSAIGAKAAIVRRLVVLEGIFIAAMSCVVTAILAPLLTALMIGNLSLPVDTPFRISALGAVIWIVVVLIGALVATLAPASRAAQLTVREALAYL